MTNTPTPSLATYAYNTIRELIDKLPELEQCNIDEQIGMIMHSTKVIENILSTCHGLLITAVYEQYITALLEQINRQDPYGPILQIQSVQVGMFDNNDNIKLSDEISALVQRVDPDNRVNSERIEQLQHLMPEDMFDHTVEQLQDAFGSKRAPLMVTVNALIALDKKCMNSTNEQLAYLTKFIIDSLNHNSEDDMSSSLASNPIAMIRFAIPHELLTNWDKVGDELATIYRCKLNEVVTDVIEQIDDALDGELEDALSSLTEADMTTPAKTKDPEFDYSSLTDGQQQMLKLAVNNTNKGQLH